MGKKTSKYLVSQEMVNESQLRIEGETGIADQTRCDGKPSQKVSDPN